MHAWELHPALVHFPIAFLVGAVVLDLYAFFEDRAELVRVATGLFVAGTVIGIFAAAAGALAFFTVPAHTEEAHRLMYWHLGIAAAALVAFAGVSTARLKETPPSAITRWVGIFGLALLLLSASIGGEIVYHGGAGIDPALLAPEVREHHHAT